MNAEPRANGPRILGSEDIPLYQLEFVPVPWFELGFERREGRQGDTMVKAQREEDVVQWLDSRVDNGSIVILRRGLVERVWGWSASWVVGQALEVRGSLRMILWHVQENTRVEIGNGGLPVDRHSRYSHNVRARYREWMFSHLATYHAEKPAPEQIPASWGEQEPWSALRALVSRVM